MITIVRITVDATEIAITVFICPLASSFVGYLRAFRMKVAL